MKRVAHRRLRLEVTDDKGTYIHELGVAGLFEEGHLLTQDDEGELLTALFDGVVPYVKCWDEYLTDEAYLEKYGDNE